MKIIEILKNFIVTGVKPKDFYSKSVVKILLFKFLFIMSFLLFAYGPHQREHIDKNVINSVILEAPTQ
jgi:hypothetical protein